LTILASGTVNLNGGGSAGGTVSDAGTLVILTGTTFTVTGTYTQTGTLTVQDAATLNLGGGSSSGAISLGNGTTLTFTGGNFTLSGSSSVTGTGGVVVSGGTTTVGGTYNISGSTTVSGGTANFTSPVTSLGSALTVSGGTANLSGGAPITVSSLTLSGGTLTGSDSLTVDGPMAWSGGTLSGTGGVQLTAANGILTVNGAANKTLDGQTLNLAGNGTWSDAGNVTLANNATINNQTGATFTIQNDQALSGSGSFNNSGTLNKTSAGAGTTTIGVAFSNNIGGTVNVQSGTLQVTGDYTQNSGDTVLSAGATLAAGGTVNLLGGTLSGSGTINGNVVNAAQVNPGGIGAVGLLTINGNYTQTASGILNIDIGGYGAGTGYDQLAVSGSVTLDGTLNVGLINGFTPLSGDQFQIVTSGSLSGTFANSNIDPSLMPPNYSATGITLVAF
jgi:hypothetical protein